MPEPQHTRKLPREAWSAYFDAQLALLRGTHAEVHVLDPRRPHFVETWDVTVDGLGFDPAAGQLRLVGDAGAFEHEVDGVQAISVGEAPVGQAVAVEVIDGEGIRHIVSFKPLKALGAG